MPFDFDDEDTHPAEQLEGPVVAVRARIRRADFAKRSGPHRFGGPLALDMGGVGANPPALHRVPGSMAGKVQQLAAAIATDYGNDASRIWTEATDGPDLKRRLLALPGIGEMKAAAIIAILGKRLGLELPGLDTVMPTHPTLGDVDSPEALASYQAGKRAMKAQKRAAADR